MNTFYLILSVLCTSACNSFVLGTLAGVTTPIPTMFSNNSDRDRVIQQLTSEVLQLKNSVKTLYQELSKFHPGGQAVSKNITAFYVRISNRLAGLGKEQIIRFDEVVVNDGDGYDARLGVFRCPQAGPYQFSLSIGSFGGIQLEIVVNGQKVVGRVFSSRTRFGRRAQYADNPTQRSQVTSATPISTSPLASGTGYLQPGSEARQSSSQAIVHLQVGDEVWVRHGSDNPHDILYANGMTTFSGHLLWPIGLN